jgi:hypothetical protein
MAVTMKNDVFWNVAPCRYCVNWRCGGTYRLHLQGRIKNLRARNQRQQEAALQMEMMHPENGGDTFLRNVSSHKIYTAPHSRRRHSSNVSFFTSTVIIKSFLSVLIQPFHFSRPNVSPAHNLPFCKLVRLLIKILWRIWPLLDNGSVNTFSRLRNQQLDLCCWVAGR